jgi:hypothetical protein
MQYHFVFGKFGGLLQVPISSFRNEGGISTAEPLEQIPYTMSVNKLKMRNNRK